jgi:protein-tyrosine phosphatase
MARLAVLDGITVVACTPHILPGVYNNAGPGIRAAVAGLQDALDKEGIPLLLTTGADVHIGPHLVEGLQSGRLLPLGESRYFLLEPPNMIVPPRFENQLFNLVSAGYVPIVTHPERLGWPERDFAIFERIVRSGCWLQITGASLLGRFGRQVRDLSRRMLGQGLVHILATGARNTSRRPPLLSESFHAAAELLGEEEALRLVSIRPAGILKNVEPGKLPPPIRL